MEDDGSTPHRVWRLDSALIAFTALSTVLVCSLDDSFDLMGADGGLWWLFGFFFGGFGRSSLTDDFDDVAGSFFGGGGLGGFSLEDSLFSLEISL